MKLSYAVIAAALLLASSARADEYENGYNDGKSGGQYTSHQSTSDYDQGYNAGQQQKH